MIHVGWHKHLIILDSTKSWIQHVPGLNDLVGICIYVNMLWLWPCLLEWVFNESLFYVLMYHQPARDYK